MSLTLTSPVFEHGDLIPLKFTCDGQNINPEIHIGGVPKGTKSLVLIMDDPDVPKVVRLEGFFDHWILFNISPDTDSIKEGSVAGVVGANGRGATSYTGPCPPPQYEPKEHRYFLKLYALTTELQLSEGASKQEVKKSMEGYILEEVELMGRYARINQQ